jgi:hypothetical protein
MKQGPCTICGQEYYRHRGDTNGHAWTTSQEKAGRDFEKEVEI